MDWKLWTCSTTNCGWRSRVLSMAFNRIAAKHVAPPWLAEIECNWPSSSIRDHENIYTILWQWLQSNTSSVDFVSYEPNTHRIVVKVAWRWSAGLVSRVIEVHWCATAVAITTASTTAGTTIHFKQKTRGEEARNFGIVSSQFLNLLLSTRIIAFPLRFFLHTAKLRPCVCTWKFWSICRIENFDSVHLLPMDLINFISQYQFLFLPQPDAGVVVVLVCTSSGYRR